MTNTTKEPEAVKRAKDLLLLEYGQDVRNYGDWPSMTNDEKRNMIEELKLLLGKIGSGCNVSDNGKSVIGQIIRELRQVQDSLV